MTLVRSFPLYVSLRLSPRFHTSYLRFHKNYRKTRKRNVSPVVVGLFEQTVVVVGRVIVVAALVVEIEASDRRKTKEMVSFSFN